jgi:biopolymer transport protein ExbB
MLTDFDWLGATSASPIFLVLIACSVITFGVAIERAVYYARRRGDPDGVLRRALDSARRGRADEAARPLESCAHPVGQVASQLFRDGGFLEQGCEERMQIALSEQKMLLDRNLGILGTMAAVSPLIGLLGTVWGIMRAFHDMARIGSAAPSVVASGVAEALVTTAAGLVIAVPALMLYNHLTRRMNAMLTVAENHARSLRTALLESAPDASDRLPARPAGPGSEPRSSRPESAPAPARAR